MHPSNHTLFITSHLPALRASLGDVEWVRYRGGGSAVHRLGAGDIEIGGTGGVPPVTGQAAGIDLVYLAASAPRPVRGGLVVPHGSDVRDAAGLRGCRVAFTIGSWQTRLLADLLAGAGLRYEDIEPVPAGPDTYGRFLAGRLDAWVAPEPPLDLLVRRHGARLLSGSDEPAADRSVFFADRTYADAHRAEVADVLAGLHRASRWIAGHPDEAAAVYAEHAPDDLPAGEDVLVADTDGLRAPDPEFLAGQQRTADALHGARVIAEPVRVADATLTDPVPVPGAARA